MYIYLYIHIRIQTRCSSDSLREKSPSDLHLLVDAGKCLMKTFGLPAAAVIVARVEEEAREREKRRARARVGCPRGDNSWFTLFRTLSLFFIPARSLTLSLFLSRALGDSLVFSPTLLDALSREREEEVAPAEEEEEEEDFNSN